MPVDPAAEGAPQPRQCGLCGDTLLESQACIQASCNVCGSQSLHAWCATSYAASRVRQHITNSKAIEKRTRAAQKRPWQELVLLRCPRGWQQGSDKGQQGSKAASLVGSSWEARHTCSGRIQTAELIDAPQEKKRKKKRAAAPPAQAGGRQHAQRQQAGGGGGRPADAGSSRAAGGPAVKMSLAAAQAFLGIEPEEKEEEEGSEEAYSNDENWEEEEEEEGWDEGASSQQQEEARQQAGDAEGAAPGAGAAAATAAAGSAYGAGGWQLPASLGSPVGAVEPQAVATAFGAAAAAAAAAPAEVPAGPAEPLTVEEAEVAVREGLLPPTYRTQLCSRYLSGLPCRQPAACPHAHSLQELRVDAAIEEGLLPDSFKTVFCASMVQTGSCPCGLACMAAHSLGEVRVRASIEAGIAPATYKAQLCPSFTTHRVCPNALLCPAAHGAHELRREAAVQLRCLHARYKMQLCDTLLITGRCPAGDICPYAHGVHDLRRHAAIRDKVFSPAFKTELCFMYESFGTCKIGHRCNFAHGPHDQLPHIVTSATLCPIFQETGHCEPTCPFAHDASDLQLPLDALRAKVQHALGISSGPHGGADAISSSGSTHLSTAALADAAFDAGGTSAGGGTHTGGCSERERDWGYTASAAAGAAGGSAGSARGALSEGGSKGPTAGGPDSIEVPSLAAPQRSRRGPRQKPPDPHEVQLAHLLAGKQRPFELRPCRTYDECGKCWTVDCPYAHGARELKEREKSWVERETERQRLRHQKRLERQRQQREQEQAEQRRQLEELAQLQEEAQLRQAVAASAQLAASSQAASVGCLAAAPTAQLSEAALALLRGHKLLLCSLKLLEAGFEEAQSRAAAEAAGGDAERAFELALGTPSPGAAPPADVSREAGQLLEHARRLGLGPTDVEQAVVLAAGDWDEAREQLAVRAAAGSSSSPAGQAPVPLPLPMPVPVASGNGTGSFAAGATAEAGGWGAEDWGAPVSAAAAWPTAETPPAQPAAAAGHPWQGPAATAAAGATQMPAANSLWPGAVAAEPAPAEAVQQVEAVSLGSAGFESFVDVISAAWLEGRQDEVPTPGVAPATPAAGVEAPAGQHPAAADATAEPLPLRELQQAAVPEQAGAGRVEVGERHDTGHAAAVAAVLMDVPTAPCGELVPAPPEGQHEGGTEAQPGAGAAEVRPAAAAAAAEPTGLPAAWAQGEAQAQPGLAAASGSSSASVAAPAATDFGTHSSSAAAGPAAGAPGQYAGPAQPAAPAEAPASGDGAPPAGAAAIGEPAAAAVEQDAAAQQVSEPVSEPGAAAPGAGAANEPVPAGSAPILGGMRPEAAAAVAVDAPIGDAQAAAAAVGDDGAVKALAEGAAAEAVAAGEPPTDSEVAVTAEPAKRSAPQVEAADVAALALGDPIAVPPAAHAALEAEAPQPVSPGGDEDTVDELLALLGIS